MGSCTVVSLYHINIIFKDYWLKVLPHVTEHTLWRKEVLQICDLKLQHYSWKFRVFSSLSCHYAFLICPCAEAHLSHKEATSTREQFKYTFPPSTQWGADGWGFSYIKVLDSMNQSSSINLTSFFLKFLQLRLLPEDIITRLFLETKSKVKKKLIFSVKKEMVF